MEKKIGFTSQTGPSKEFLKAKQEFDGEEIMENKIDQREKDIQEVCRKVIDSSTTGYDNPNGGYESYCLFCSAMESRGGGGKIWASMNELSHDSDCIYLIAKDLMTGI